MRKQLQPRRLLVVAIAAVGALALASCSSTGTTPATSGPKISSINIGLVFPTTGAFAVLGTAQEDGVKVALDWANKNGGIDGVPIKVFEADSQSDAGVGATAAQRLIDQNNVSIIIGSYASGISQAIMPVAQRNNVVLWEVGAVSPAINAAGNSNFLRTVGGSQTYANADFDFLKNYLAPKFGKKLQDLRIGIAHEDGAFGTSVADAIVSGGKKLGLNVVANEAYASSSTDLTPVVLRLKAAKPDVLLMTPLVADTMLFWAEAKTQNFDVQAVIGSAGFSSPSFVQKFGAAGVEGAFDVEAPSVADMNSKGLSPKIASLLDTWRASFKAQYGQECLVHCGDGLGGGYILVSDVLPRALKDSGTVDAKAILAAAAKTNIPDGGTPQGFGVKFNPPGGPNVGDNAAAKSYIMQWQGGVLKVVWPSSLAVASPVFPMSTWSQR
jgi:branched-chain amino acid transport system substrate-binding protein